MLVFAIKAYFVYGNETGYSKQQRQATLEKIGKELGLVHIALTYFPSMTDEESEAKLNKIDPAAKNTFVIYRHRNIIDKYINPYYHYTTIESLLHQSTPANRAAQSTAIRIIKPAYPKY